MLQQASQVESPREERQLGLSFARTQGEVLEAQRLRYKVFAEEMGAHLSGPEGVDQDRYDPFCEHLLVRDVLSGEVVGTYRIINPDAARQAGGYYSSGEFDMSRLAHLESSMVEIGRSCVHVDYRNGTTISLLWAGLANYMQKNGYEYLIGCASVAMIDGGHMAASLYRRLQDKFLSPAEYRVFPNCPLPLAALNQELPAVCPPLIKGYLRAGAWICGEPHWDPDFNTADLMIMLPMSRLSQRYADHYMK